MTALSCCVVSFSKGVEDLKAMVVLLDAGAEVNACDLGGATVLMKACQEPQPLVNLLLARGASTTQTDNSGKTAADVFEFFTPSLKRSKTDRARFLLLGGKRERLER
jgi:hypothetical protein